jgi:hypothetical protein
MMTEEHEEEYEGVTVNIEPDDWPEDLAGILVNGKSFYIKNGMLKITGDPIWVFGAVHDD